MRHEAISREMMAGPVEPPNDIELIMHAAWLLAGVAIALAASGCTASDESQLQARPEAQNQMIAHAKPSPTSSSGNVEDMTY